MDDNLERTLQKLHESGIDATVESHARDGMHVRIGNDKGERARTRIVPDDVSSRLSTDFKLP